MSLHLITAPTDEVVTLVEVKKQLRQTSSDYDDVISALIKAAVQGLDPAFNGWLGRALRPQTWEWRGEGFPYGTCGSGYSRNFRPYNYIELPYPPLISVDSVKYYDSDGVDTTMTAGTDYRVLGGGNGKSYVTPIYNGSWPTSVRSDDESVRVQFTAGYQLSSPDSLPAEIKQAVILMVRDQWSLTDHNLYLSSEAVPGLGSYDWTVTENAGKVITAAVEKLLGNHRVFD